MVGAVDCDCHARGVGCLHAGPQRLAEVVAAALAQVRAEQRAADARTLEDLVAKARTDVELLNGSDARTKGDLRHRSLGLIDGAAAIRSDAASPSRS